MRQVLSGIPQICGKIDAAIFYTSNFDTQETATLPVAVFLYISTHEHPNQADMALKGRGWNKEKNQPEPELIEFLDAKVESTKKRIKEATGVDVEPIYYSAGYKDGTGTQNPYNLSKLLVHILRNTEQEKRIVFAQDINKDPDMWGDDGLGQHEIQEIFIDSIKAAASKGSDIGGEIGEGIGKVLGSETLGRALGSVVGVIKSIGAQLVIGSDGKK